MSAPNDLVFLVLGLGAGAAYAAIALGLVVVHTGAGVLNLAQATFAMWAAYVYDEIRVSGDLVLPVGRIGLAGVAGGRSAALACVAGVLSAAGLAFVAHLAVFRPLRRASALAGLVAGVGVMLTLQALVVLRFGTNARSVAPILPSGAVRVGSLTFSRQVLYLAALTLVAAGALSLWLRLSRTGLAVRGAAQNELAAALAGYSPDALAGLAWVLGAVLTAVLALLAAPATGLNPAGYALFVVPALAAALAARLERPIVACVVALLIGSVQAELSRLATRGWWPGWAVAGAGDVVPFAVVVIALFVVGGRLPLRGAPAGDAMAGAGGRSTTPPLVGRWRALSRTRTEHQSASPSVTAGRWWPPARLATGRGRGTAHPATRRLRVGGWACLVVLGAGALALASGSYRFGLVTSMTVAVIALSLVVLTGLVGQVSLAQAAFAGAAGFALSRLTTGVGVPFPWALLLAALVAALAGILVGVPALRIRGVQLAVVTLAAGVAIEQFVFRNPKLSPPGGNTITDPSLFGIDLAVRRGSQLARLPFALMVLAVLALAAIGVVVVARGRGGRRFLAVRSNERAAAAVGVDVAGTKLVAFGLSSFLAGIGGGLIGYSRGQLSADSFTALTSLTWVAFAYVGGIGSVAGALVAGLFAPLGIVYVVADRDAGLGRWWPLLTGLALVLTTVTSPEGLAGRGRQLLGRVARRGGRLDSDEPAQDRRPAPMAPGLAAAPSTEIAVPVPRPRSVTLPRGSIGLRGTGGTGRVGGGLEVRELSVRHGGVLANDRVSLSVPGGRIVGLIGPNGAGKTTLVDAITGFLPTEGEVELDGRDVSGLAPHRRTRLGLVRTWQSLELFADLSVLDHVLVAYRPRSVARPGNRRRIDAPGRDAESAMSLLASLWLASVAERRPVELPLGARRSTGLARALGSDPAVLLLDEPAAGLGPGEVDALVADLRRLADAGLAILLVEHDTGLVFDVCDEVVVLERGRVLARGTPAEVRDDPQVVAAYLGGAAAPADHRAER
jgi:ABC-type branched-subunit amino acid transport system ATPase component/ABC-type branched-subunit amino acid transport system permease subunit